MSTSLEVGDGRRVRRTARRPTGWVRAAPPLGGLALVAVLQLLLSEYWESVAVTIALASISAMALTVLMGWVGQASLLTAALLLAGGYSAYVLDVKWGMPFVVTAAGTFLAGAAIGIVASLPARRLTGIYLLLGTLAVQFIMGDVGNIVQSETGALAGYTLPNMSIFGFEVATTGQWLWVSAITLMAVYGYFRYLAGTRVGRAWAMIKADPRAAEVAGVRVPIYVMLGFAVTSGVTAVGGMLLAFNLHNVSYDAFGILYAVSYLVMVVLGGFGSLLGAVVGAMIVTLLPILIDHALGGASGTSWVSANLSYIEVATYGVVGILALIFVPRGLGELIERRARTWWGRAQARRRRTGEPAPEPMEAPGEDVLAALRNVTAEHDAGEIGLSDASLDIPRTGATVLLGRNGSGKTSLLHAIIGFPPGSGGRIVRGRVEWRDGDAVEQLSRLSTGERARRGITLVPAEDKVFRTLTVREHLVEALRSSGRRDSSGEALEDILILFPVLRERLDALAGLLSGGERQQLALSAALARRARLLLVDEASLGLSPAATQVVVESLRRIKEGTATALVAVEQSPAVGFQIGDVIVLVEAGRIATSAPPSEEYQLELERHYLGVSELLRPEPDERPVIRARLATGRKLLRVDDVSFEVAGIKAVSGVSLAVDEGQAVGLIGANGAGKTSLLNIACGYYRPTSGAATFEGEPLAGLSPQQIIARGASRSFQAVGHVSAPTVAEFVRLGWESQWPARLPDSLLRTPRGGRVERERRHAAYELIEGAGLGAYADAYLHECSYGVRKMADLLRTFAARPRLLLLDEPTSGVSMVNRGRIREMIAAYLAETNAGLLLVDHDVDFVSQLCPELVVLSAGRVIARGGKDEVLALPEVIRAFVGVPPGEAVGDAS